MNPNHAFNEALKAINSPYVRGPQNNYGPMNTQAVNEAVKLFMQIEAMKTKLNKIVNSLSKDEYWDYRERIK